MKKTEITKTTSLIMCIAIILGLIIYIFIIKEFVNKDNDYKKLGLEIKPAGKNGEETLEQAEFKEMLVEWYFSGNWVTKWEEVD